MKIKLLLFLVSSFATIVWAQDQKVPLEYRIQQGVTFYLGFNLNSVVASRAAGDHEPTQIVKKVGFVQGVKGSALRTGENGAELTFNLKDNLSFELPGSMSIWIKPVKWKYPKDMPIDKNGQRERVFQSFFLTNYKETGYLGFQRMSSYEIGGKDQLKFWVSGFTGIEASSGRGITWADEQWHNVVFTWDPVQFKLYIDGELKAHSTIQRKIKSEELSDLFSVHCPPETVIDEFIVYDHLLSDEQVQEFYRYYADGAK